MTGIQVPDRLPFRLNRPVRLAAEEEGGRGRVLVASGTRARNRDFWTGKPYRLLPDGMRTGAWEANGGLVLWMHNFNIPLGRGEMFLDGGQLWAWDDINFHGKVIPIATQNWIGDAVGTFDTGVIADLWQERILNAVSIHVMFTPEDEENIVETDEEIIIPTSEVIEFSIVTVPGDREAVRQNLQQAGMQQELAQLVCDNGVCDVVRAPVQGSAAYEAYTSESSFLMPAIDFGMYDAEIEEECDDCPDEVPQGLAERLEEVLNNVFKRYFGASDTASSGGSDETQDVEEENMSEFVAFNEDEAAEPTPTTPPAEAEAAAEQEEMVVEEVEQVFEYELDPVSLAQAIAASEEAVVTLAQALARNPQVRELFLQEVAQTQAPQPRIVFKMAGNGQEQPQAQQPVRREAAQAAPQANRAPQPRSNPRQRVAATQTPVPQNGVQQKADHPLLRMNRNL